MESRLTERAPHQTTLPFTRYLAGPADYTTMIFNDRRRETSWAHQIASMAVFASPLLTISANPNNILANPAVDLIKSIPSVWDETIVLPNSSIGELVVFARRTSNTWFLAVMNGTKTRTLRIPLSFLGPGNYKAMLVGDDKKNSGAVKIKDATLKHGKTLTIDLRAGGGFIGQFSK
jgi:alpha-glucosidase